MIKLLLIEDSPLDVRLFREYISHSAKPIEVITTGTLNEGISQAEEADVTVMDLGLPDSFGLETFTKFYSAVKRMPIIILTGNEDEVQAVEAVKMGAQDYISKNDLERKLLLRSIDYAMERFRIEEELRERERIYKELVENSPDMICRLSNDMRIIYANSGIIQAFGMKYDNQKNEYSANGNSFLNNLTVITIFNKAKLTGVNAAGEANLITSSGTGTFSVRIIPEINTDKNPQHYLCLITDITEKKHGEYEKEMLQAQLHQAQKMEAIGQLAGGIAHDFNNMLAGIIGNAEILSSEITENKEWNEFAANIISISESASELTRQLLDFSRKNTGNFKTQDVHRIIQDSVSILRNTLDRNISIEMDLKAETSKIECEESYIKNALINLGVNARDAMPNGGRLLFRTENIIIDESYAETHMNALVPGQYVRISCMDTGEGIPESLKSKIFEPFFTTKDKGKGTGLGLASVYNCMQNHRGTVDVYSEEHYGTEFKLYIPTSEAEYNSGKVQVFDDGTVRAYNILLIDDETMIREISMKILKKLGHNVYSFADLEQSIEFFRNKSKLIDTVILDLVMPEKSGEEVFDELKTIDPDVKIIICSGFSINERIKSAKAKGAAEFINKPFKAIDLQTTLKSVMEP